MEHTDTCIIYLLNTNYSSKIELKNLRFVTKPVYAIEPFIITVVIHKCQASVANFLF